MPSSGTDKSIAVTAIYDFLLIDRDEIGRHAALDEASRRSDVSFCRPWQPPQLQPWEGPFADPKQRLPQATEVAAERAS